MYFEHVMHLATNAHLEINTDTMHQYVDGLAALKTMMHMLTNELDRDPKIVYLDAIEARVLFQKDISTDYTYTIMDYQAWHQFTTVNHHEDVEGLVFPQLSAS